MSDGFPVIAIKDNYGRTTITFDGHEIKGVYAYRVWRNSRADMTHIELVVQDDVMTMDYNGGGIPDLPEPYRPYYKAKDERWEKILQERWEAV